MKPEVVLLVFFSYNNNNNNNEELKHHIYDSNIYLSSDTFLKSEINIGRTYSKASHPKEMTGKITTEECAIHKCTRIKKI